MKDENYIVVQGWMRKELGLKGYELLAYALIFGFCQDGESTFKGSLSYVAEWLGCSKPTAISTLKTLVSKGLIERIEEPINGILFVRYRVLTTSKEILPPSKEILPNKIDDNIDSKKDNTNVLSKKEPAHDDIEIENEIVNHTSSEELRAMLREFVEYRRHKRERMSERAFKMMLNKLEGFTDEEQIDALETSIISNWAGVFPKHKDRGQNEQKAVGKVAHGREDYNEDFDMASYMERRRMQG